MNLPCSVAFKVGSPVSKSDGAVENHGRQNFRTRLLLLLLVRQQEEQADVDHAEHKPRCHDVGKHGFL